MSNEIRTQINDVIGLTELLLGTELNEGQRKYAELIKLFCKNILDLSQNEAHKIEMERRNFDHQGETTATMNLLLLLAKEKGRELSSRSDAVDTDAATSSRKQVIFDQDEFVARSLGDLELCRCVATIFLENAPEYIGAIRSALTAEDAVALQGSAHKLKGAAETMALPLLAETAYLFESSAETGDLKKAASLLPELTRQFEQALEALQEIFLEGPERSP